MSNGTRDDHNEGVTEFNVGRTQTPSIDSQAYAIPITDEFMSQLSDSHTSSSEEANESDEVSPRSSGNSSTNDEFLDEIVPETTNTLFMDTQDPGAMIDVPKYIYDSLTQALESVNFSESVALQTKLSAVINSKSLELKQLIDEANEKLSHLRVRYQRGIATSQNIKANLNYSKEKIKKINSLLSVDFPIEFNQARDKILERQLDDEEEGDDRDNGSNKT
ncbi:hypothetical protein KAFR_0C02210 [Kazachstania africana CBS 2517]|uniref:Biogenesis of lysosome-related organelles complex 1 subunit KXD1 n=1 Tax=Kazachstania africana (strain ATCC 22294 / BCRC 22015 / CBS 2517 / CECT 1963 / NBRC 1671 / NRRL Y-8276) TaxID=1071382 RepID=H2AS64_KAZAF|nr:hypothetical protein KAFR_0C02210 [Kazachstania africana CBS 2517]CCF57214.1 hypothetical protein KAFR_0C02210 [Kazachstania africana CBS 2517]